MADVNTFIRRNADSYMMQSSVYDLLETLEVEDRKNVIGHSSEDCVTVDAMNDFLCDVACEIESAEDELNAIDFDNIEEILDAIESVSEMLSRIRREIY